MDDDDDFGADADFIQALAAASPEVTVPSRARQSTAQAVQQPTPQRIQQPTPQRVERGPVREAGASSGGSSSATGPAAAPGKIVQPTPQALPTRGSGSAILVSPRQKNNPVLTWIKSIPWEYSDIPADYGLGLTTCALFLSLKYHRLHPEYIYTRIRNLQGKYTLRVLLTMVDVPSHEDALRELSKTALVNNVTLVLCWSAQEAARYLELYKSYEHANFSAIRAAQATGYAERLVEFVTVPRAINKADAVALVSTFGSLRNAVNADAEQVASVGGWGERKVKSWCKVVEQPFRVRKAGAAAAAARKRAPTATPLREAVGATQRAGKATAAQTQIWNPNIADEYDEDAALQAALAESSGMAGAEQDVGVGSSSGIGQTAPEKEQLSEGIAAALAKLRENG
ncbi:mating-type switching protein swi10 [Gaeumannomyces tritici R3-111a-1]|uniref:Mating-type switching protein swi10 n=1 Tax=Gaeumannomyces tritici (strain R3-111a-1) TaxID=644352 RepID=J3NG14_GAET3|nr:mating-type switching protein swi10 [Gaeumannomyces tritici R3-111a-1]EJT80204.1 mating-type switching protein swi10 [Gaeumannomyces tritici R3-111a-1]